jgi:GTP diphosphokinase / guanosine-3',5'-bis(diphosphate) 3'-diphosphatase
MSNYLAKAIAIASSAFEDKTDKAGEPYILHCLRVMNSVSQDDHELMSIAALHDVVEDTDITLEDLRALGFSLRVLTAVDLLTHRKADTYEEYIKKISTNPDAVKVKLADLKDNSNITRLKGLRKKDFDRVEKYHKAFVYLSN